MSVSENAVFIPPSDALIRPSGTLDQAPHQIPSQSSIPITNALPIARTESSKSTDSEEQALEWHEVIELQAFSERKVWIEEKIKVGTPCFQFLKSGDGHGTFRCGRKCHLSKSTVAWTPYALPPKRSRVFRLELNSRNGSLNTIE